MCQEYAGRITAGPLPAHAVALAGLVEPVAGHLGADGDGLEKNVVARFAGHRGIPSNERSGNCPTRFIKSFQGFFHLAFAMGQREEAAHTGDIVLAAFE